MTNPLLAKVKLPGRIFQLPSKGLFYEAGVLASHVTDGEIQVQPLSALAEMKLRSPDMLFSGRAISEVCQECIPDILKSEKLCAKDIDAIFCFLKVVTYGPDMKFKSVHGCKEGKVHEYMSNIESITMVPNNSILDHIDMLYSATLSNGQSFKLKPVTFQDAIEMSHLQREIETSIAEKGSPDPTQVDKSIVKDIMAVVSSVEGITDPIMIEEWVRALQKKYITEIIDASIASNGWGFNLSVPLTCKDCGDVYTHNLELNPINFFSE